MKTLITLSLYLAFTACNNGGTKDNKNEMENYPSYDSTAQMENINNGGTDNQLAEPSNADANHSTH